jgi:hypothetical protein
MSSLLSPLKSVPVGTRVIADTVADTWPSCPAAFTGTTR